MYTYHIFNYHIVLFVYVEDTVLDGMKTAEKGPVLNLLSICNCYEFFSWHSFPQLASPISFQKNYIFSLRCLHYTFLQTAWQFHRHRLLMLILLLEPLLLPLLLPVLLSSPFLLLLFLLQGKANTCLRFLLVLGIYILSYMAHSTIEIQTSSDVHKSLHIRTLGILSVTYVYSKNIDHIAYLLVTLNPRLLISSSVLSTALTTVNTSAVLSQR